MPRGGRRENAGKKSTWGSGRNFSETKVIRVPVEFANQLLEIAHKLDAGEILDLDTKSIQRENEGLKEEIGLLEQRLSQTSNEIKRLEAEKESYPAQLELFSMNTLPLLPNKGVLVKIRDRCLKRLSAGKQSKQYAHVREIFNEFIDIMLSGKY